MANIMQNRIDAVLPIEAMEEIKDHIMKAIVLLPEEGKISLNDQERYSLSSIDVDNKIFVEDTINVMKQSGPDILPAYISPKMIEKDLVLFTQMDEIFGYIEDFRKRVLDYRRMSASEAVNVANKVMGLYESAADSGVPGAQAGYDKMKVRYKPKGGGNSERPVE